MDMLFNDSSIETSCHKESRANASRFTVTSVSIIVCLCIILLLGTVGNGLVIKSFLKQTNTAGSKFVIALAISDFLNSIFGPVRIMQNVISQSLHPTPTIWPVWFLGKTLCRAMYGVSPISLCVTSWILVAISSERYR